MPGFLQNPTGFLAPTGFTNYLQQYSGAYPGQRSVGGMFPGSNPRQQGGNVAGANLSAPNAGEGNPSFPGGMGFANSPGLSTQEQYGGPLMQALQNLVRGTNVAGNMGMNSPKPPQNSSANGQDSPESQVQGVK